MMEDVKAMDDAKDDAKDVADEDEEDSDDDEAEGECVAALSWSIEEMLTRVRVYVVEKILDHRSDFEDVSLPKSVESHSELMMC